MTSANNNTQESARFVYPYDKDRIEAEALRAGTWVHVDTEGRTRRWVLHGDHAQAYIDNLPESYAPIARILQALLDTGIVPGGGEPCFVENCWFAVTEEFIFGDGERYYPEEEELAIQLVRAMSIELEESWFGVTQTHPIIWYLPCRK